MTVRRRLERLERLELMAGRQAPAGPDGPADMVPHEAYLAMVAAIPESGEIPAEPPAHVDPRLRDLWYLRGALCAFGQSEGATRPPGVHDVVEWNQ